MLKVGEIPNDYALDSKMRELRTEQGCWEKYTRQAILICRQDVREEQNCRDKAQCHPEIRDDGVLDTLSDDYAQYCRVLGIKDNVLRL